MDLEQALLWYAQGRFTADDVTRATGLSERSQRELLKLGILRPIPQARTKTRLLDRQMLKRAAVISPLNKLGFSLQVAGRIVYAAPLLEDLIFPIVDPWSANFALFSDSDPKTGLPQRRTLPH